MTRDSIRGCDGKWISNLHMSSAEKQKQTEARIFMDHIYGQVLMIGNNNAKPRNLCASTKIRK